MKQIVIDERLAQALLTLLRVGRFADVQYGELRAVEDALLAAIASANVDVQTVPAAEAVGAVVADFPAAAV